MDSDKRMFSQPVTTRKPFRGPWEARAGVPSARYAGSCARINISIPQLRATCTVSVC